MARAFFRDLLEAIPALLFPDRCGACESLCEGPFCAPCAETLLPVPAGCPLCGEPGDEALLPALRPPGSAVRRLRPAPGRRDGADPAAPRPPAGAGIRSGGAARARSRAALRAAGALAARTGAPDTAAGRPRPGASRTERPLGVPRP